MSTALGIRREDRGCLLHPRHSRTEAERAFYALGILRGSEGGSNAFGPSPALSARQDELDQMVVLPTEATAREFVDECQRSLRFLAGVVKLYRG